MISATMFRDSTKQELTEEQDSSSAKFTSA